MNFEEIFEKFLGNTIYKELVSLACVGVSPVICSGAESPWYWNTPQKPQNTVITQAKQGHILQNPRVMFFKGGELAVVVAHNRYHSDAVIEDIEIQYFASVDGGKSWQRCNKLPQRFSPVMGNHSRRPLRLPGGILLAVGSRGWENFPDTEENRERLTDQGYYIFTPEEGNAPDVISIIHRVWMSRSSDGGQTWQTNDIKLPVFMPHLAC